MQPMNEQTAKEFLDEYVQTVKERDEFRDICERQSQEITTLHDQLFKEFDMLIDRILWAADRSGLTEEKVRSLAKIAGVSVDRMYKDNDDA